MYTIEIPKEPRMANGKPFRLHKEDENGRRIPLKDANGELLSPPGFETFEASYLDMLTFFLNNLFFTVELKHKENKEIKTLNMEDSSYAVDVFRSMHVANGLIEVEKKPKEWLESMLTQHGVDLMGLNTAVILDPVKKAVEGTINRAEKRRETKK